jgi:Xaa-Pro aminopeptidase
VHRNLENSKMKKIALEARRNQVMEQMEEGSVAVIYSGIDIHVSLDEYFPFEVNKSFFYLTEIARNQMILFLDKTNVEKPRIILYIEKADPKDEKWFGKKLTIEEAQLESGIDQVEYLDNFSSTIGRMLSGCAIKKVYFDLSRENAEDMSDYNMVKAEEFKTKYQGIVIADIFPIIAYLRMAKDADEVAKIQSAIDITKQGLEDILRTLKPGMKEYQVQANYEYRIRYLGASGPSFQTIAGSGYNGTMLHYETNQCECMDGDLILMDLGAKYQGYCSDITRTYPINGKFSHRQREIYELVLKANKEVIAQAKPGMTTIELNDICKKILAEGLIHLKLIKEEKELSTYYMHGVSHHLGLDVHDATHPNGKKLRPGCVITNEPGLYIEEEKIGIRIEDDLLITENGCEVLSKNIIKEIDDIERFMAKDKR